MTFVEVRRAHEIGDQFGDEREVAGQRAAVEHGLIASRPRVEASADILDRFGKRPGVAAARALEDHMLDEMGEPAHSLRLRTRSDARVEPDGD